MQAKVLPDEFDFERALFALDVLDLGFFFSSATGVTGVELTGELGSPFISTRAGLGGKRVRLGGA